MTQNLSGKVVAILVADGFEESELSGPKKALEDAGATALIVSPNEREVRSWSGKDWGQKYKVDLQLGREDEQRFDALLLPGGVKNPDSLRMIDRAVQFVKTFVDSGKPIGAICHAPWMLIEAADLHGMTVTSWPALKSDLRNAGANWVDQEVVVDNGIVTSRKPEDIPAFSRKLIEEIHEGPHVRTHQSAA